MAERNSDQELTEGQAVIQGLLSEIKTARASRPGIARPAVTLDEDDIHRMITRLIVEHARSETIRTDTEVAIKLAFDHQLLLQQLDNLPLPDLDVKNRLNWLYADPKESGQAIQAVNVLVVYHDKVDQAIRKSKNPVLLHLVMTRTDYALANLVANGHRPEQLFQEFMVGYHQLIANELTNDDPHS
jgi:hypothetical protein